MEKIKLEEVVSCESKSGYSDDVFRTAEAAAAVKEQFEKKQGSGNPVAVIHQKITNSKGEEMYKFIGSNATTIGGTQNIVYNTFDGIPSTALTLIENLDSESGMNLDPVAKYNSTKRLIFGFGVGYDGANGKLKYPVKRHTKGYDITKLMAFTSTNTTLEDIDLYFDKYAMRSVTTDGYAQYFIKKITPQFFNVTIDDKIIPDNPDVAYKGTAEVMSKVVFDLVIEPEEVIPFWAYKNSTESGCTVNSIMLFAGRSAEVTAGGNQVTTYRDCICTNKVNFSTIYLEDTRLEFEYTLYYI